MTPDGLSIEFAVRTNRTMGGMFLQARKPTTSIGISRHDATATLQAVKELYEAGFLMIKVFDGAGDEISLPDLEKLAVEQGEEYRNRDLTRPI